MKTLSQALAVTALAACTLTAGAQTPPPGRGDSPAYGPGMMGAYGPQGGYGPGMMGGGMMGGYGPGPGAGPGYGPGQGRGMMDGYGPDMMMGGGYGRGGMMGLGPLQALNLSEQQLARINQIRDEVRRKNWDTLGKLLDEQARLRDLYTADKRDAAAIGKQSMKIAELRRQLLEASIDSHNRIEALLSTEQKDQLRSWRRGWMMDDD